MRQDLTPDISSIIFFFDFPSIIKLLVSHISFHFGKNVSRISFDAFAASPWHAQETERIARSFRFAKIDATNTEPVEEIVANTISLLVLCVLVFNTRLMSTRPS